MSINFLLYIQVMSSHQDDKEDEFDHDDDDDDGDSGEFDLVDFDTLRMIEETDEFWLFGFVPNLDSDEDDEARAFMKKVDGTLRINKRGKFLEYITSSFNFAELIGSL